MSPKNLDRIIAGVALVALLILFVLVAMGLLNVFTAIVITVVIAVGVRLLRSTFVNR